MRYSFDFEFLEGNLAVVDGACLPISVGICEIDGDRTYYAEWRGAADLARAHGWLSQYVLPHLRGNEKDAETIRLELLEFFGDAPVDLYADCGAYDFFLLSRALGGFLASPPNFPYTYIDTHWLRLPNARVGAEHNALDDALTVREQILRAEVE